MALNEAGIYQPDDDFLEHHGIKGMRWGHHKAKAEGSTKTPKAAKPEKPKKLSGKEKRAARRAADEKKANDLLNEALKNPQTLIKLNTGYGPTIVTGKEFVEHLINGGYMNVRSTDIYARQDKSGQYVLA